MIYLASPYTHEDPAVKEQRFRAVCEVASKMMQTGIHVFSPIAHTHPIAEFGLPGHWEFWEEYDRKFIKWCDSVTVLMLDGWQDSKGVNAEISIAVDLGKPVAFYHPERGYR